MNILRLAAFAALLLSASPASAQWQTPNHSVPIGRGAGVTGFGSAAPGTTGIPFTSNGASADPTFHPATNAGIAPGAANTLKGSLDGTTTADVAVPACSSVGQALQWTAGVGLQCYAISVFTGFDMPVNMGLSAAAVGNALTITLTTADGSVPTVTSPVLVPFRSTTATLGTVTWRTITSTRTLTIPSGATMGASSSSVPFRLWVFLADNGGTPELAVASCSSGTSIFPCASWETTLKTSIVLDTSSDSAGVLYAPTAVASDAVRIIGYCNFSSGLATAGTWASSCTNLQPMGPGIKKPGDEVQNIYTPNGAVSNTTNTYAPSATAPTAAGAGVVASQAITPTSAVNQIEVTGRVVFSSSGANAAFTVFIYDGTVAKAVSNAVGGASSGVGGPSSAAVEYQALAGSTSAVTYSIYGTASGGTTTFNGNGGATQWYGGISNSFIRVREIMGALPEPANDNVHPGVFSKVG